MAKMNLFDFAAVMLLIVGGLNWGMIGLFSFDFVAAMFGTLSAISKVVYAVIGIASVYSIYSFVKLNLK